MRRSDSWQSPTMVLVAVFTALTALTLLLVTVAAMSIPGPVEQRSVSRQSVAPSVGQQPAETMSGPLEAATAPVPERAEPRAQPAPEVSAQTAEEPAPVDIASDANAPVPSEPTNSVAAPPAPSASGEVTIVNFNFQPATLTVPVGATVSWVNNDTAPHTATGDAGLWDSGLLARGSSTWSKTFAEPGTFSYFCDFHPEMRGTVIVGDGSGPVAPAATPITAPASEPAVVPEPAEPAPEPAPVQEPVSSSAKQVNAQISNDRFSPATITVAVGDVITWTNNDRKRHTVSAQDGSFNSGTLGAGAQWSYTATTSGTFAYICDFHSNMRGTLVVTSGSGSPAELPAFEPQPGLPSSTQPLTPGPTPGSTSDFPRRAEISLSGSSAYPNVRGTARFEDEGEGIRLRVELNGASALGGSTLDVLIGGSKVGTVSVENRGRARLDLRGSTALPTTAAGMTLEVKTPQGVLVASGTF